MHARGCPTLALLRVGLLHFGKGAAGGEDLGAASGIREDEADAT